MSRWHGGTSRDANGNIMLSFKWNACPPGLKGIDGLLGQNGPDAGKGIDGDPASKWSHLVGGEQL